MSGLAGTNAVTPAGATILLEGRRVTLSPLYPPCTGRNPRIRPGSSVVIVAFLLEGGAWYTATRWLWSVVVIFSGRNGRGVP